MARDQSSLSIVRSPQQNFAPTRDWDFLTPSWSFGASPWQMMRRMQEEMDRTFGQFLTTPFTEIAGEPRGQVWSPSVDISENEKEWSIEADLPGVKKDDLDVQVHNGQIRIRAEARGETEEKPQQDKQRQYHRRERFYGSFERSFPLPEGVDENAVRCDYRDGVLTCHLPKTAQAVSKARKLEIGDGRSAAEQPDRQKKAA